MSERFRFWLVTVAAALGVAITAALGQWQLGRAAQKAELQALMDARQAQAPLDGAALLRAGADAALLQRPIEVRGQWLPEHTIFLDNRQMNGRPGFYVLTPLRIEGGASAVLVQRGWAPRDFQDRLRLPRIDTPAGPVTVSGHVLEAPSRLYELGQGSDASGPIRQNLDLAQYAAQTGLTLTPLAVRQAGPASEGLLREWPHVGSGVEKHHGYAFQWFGLSALIAIPYVWFQIVRRYRRRSER